MFGHRSQACALPRSQAAVDQQSECRAMPSCRRSIRRSLRVAPTVAPAFAALVAAILRTPCAEPGTPASLHACRNIFPKDSLVSGCPALARNERQIPTCPAASVFASTGRIGSVTATVKPDFSVLIVPMPSLTCCLPKRTASPRRKPESMRTSSHTRCRVPIGHRRS